MTNWANEISNIQTSLDAGISLVSIGESYGVSKQRIYQVLVKYGVATPNRKKNNFLRGKSLKYYWLNKMLVHKKFSKNERLLLLQTLELPDYCPILGCVLDYSGEGFRKEHSPSIDRIDSSKGYSIDNIHVISWRANRIKNDGTPAELRKIADYMDACILSRTMV